MPTAGSSKGLETQTLTNNAANACTNACTDSADSTKDEPEACGIDADFGEALKMIASLPLSKAEKAEAVRRLLSASQ